MRIDDGQNTQLPARGQLVMDKIHRPDLVRMRGIGSVFPELGLHPPFGRLVPQLKAQLVVKPACPLHVDRPALTQQKNVYTAISVAHARLADLLDPLLQRSLLTAPRLVCVWCQTLVCYGVSMKINIPLIRAGALSPIIRWASDTGKPIDEILSEADMEYVSLADIDTPVPMRNAGLLLSILARLEGPNVCCRIAFDSDIMELGPIGAIALAAPTPRLALEAVSMNMASHSTHEVISVESTSACITVGYGCSVRFEPIVLHLIQQYTASLIYRLISVTANDEPPFTSVSMFPHPEHGLTHLSKWFQVQPRTELDGYMRIEVPARLANKAFRISGDRVVGAYGKLNLDRIDTSLEGTIEFYLATAPGHRQAVYRSSGHSGRLLAPHAATCSGRAQPNIFRSA